MNLRQFFTSNHWYGKIIGCFLGYAMTHSPVGALFGLLIGNFFDRGLSAHFSQFNATWYDEKRETVQKIFFEATFTIMGHVAKADGRVSENEIQMARNMMSELHLSREQKQLAKGYFNTGKAADFDMTRLLTLLLNACRHNPDLLKLFMDIQYRYAQVDGLSSQKLQLLDTIFRTMGFAPLNQQYRYNEDFSGQRYSGSSQGQQAGTTSHSLTQAYAILEIDPSASKQDVKRAYRRMISKNHPDKLIAQGLPEKMIKLANDKTQKITRAYEEICAVKGW